MASNRALILKKEGQGYGMVRSYLGSGYFNVQVLGVEQNSVPCIVIGVPRGNLRVAAGDIVLFVDDESTYTSEIVEIIKIYERHEVEQLIVRGEITGRFELVPEE